MPLEVLIATPSGSLGELIRLTLETGPGFHCTLIDKGEGLWAAIRSGSFQAVVYDCFFNQPGPDEVAKTLRNEFPKLALLFIPAEANPDIVQFLNILADGIISRPFDAALLPEIIKNAVNKRANNPSSLESIIATDSGHPPVNTLQEAIKETTASFGLIIKNRAVESSTEGMNPLLQDQVVSAVTRYWNPADTSDLMRYIKDPESNQEWMMYATQITDYRVLALIYQKQTAVTSVRIQTVQLARQIAKNQPFSLPVFQPDEEITEFQEPLNLQKILGNSDDEKTSNTSANFPVEWFREMDLAKPSFTSGSKEEPDQEAYIPLIGFESEKVEEESSDPIQQTPEQKEILKNVDVKPFDFADFEPQPQVEDIPVETPAFEPGMDEPLVKDLEVQDVEKKHSVNLSDTSPTNLDLGSFQPVDLIAESPGAAGLDSFQPVDLIPDNLPKIPEEAAAPVEIEESIPDSASGISEISDMPVEEMDLSANQAESPEQTLVDNWPDFESEKSGLLTEQDSFSEKNAMGNSIPEDLTDIPDFEALPFFMSTPIKEPPADEYDIFKTGDMKSELSPDGQYKLQPEGEPAMENDHFEDENKISLSGKTSDTPEIGASSDLFARMNQLQTSAKNEETETITVALIPWQESFILHRQIAQALNQRMSNLCQAFGWKLENLTIRPTYMQFTVTITKLFSQDDMVGIVRQQTSQALSESLPGLQLPNDLEDIWAPENMTASGKDFVPSNQWLNFLNRRKTNEIA